MIHPTPGILQKITSYVMQKKVCGGVTYLGMLSISSIHNRSAADLREHFAMAIERPQADLVAADNVLDEENTTTEAQR